MLRDWLSWVYVTASVMWRSWLSSLLRSHVSDVTLSTFFGFMFKMSVMLRRFLSLRRNTSKNLKNIQVLAAASLHRQPGLKAILNAMTAYRKDCLAGIVKLSSKPTLDVVKHGKRKMLMCGQMAFCNIFPLEISRNHDKPPLLSSFSRRRDRGCARIYIYIDG